MTSGEKPSRLTAIGDLIASAEKLHGEYCGISEFEECCSATTFEALRALGVKDFEIGAAARKLDRDMRDFYRQQREEVAH